MARPRSAVRSMQTNRCPLPSQASLTLNSSAGFTCLRLGQLQCLAWKSSGLFATLLGDFARRPSHIAMTCPPRPSSGAASTVWPPLWGNLCADVVHNTLELTSHVPPKSPSSLSEVSGAGKNCLRCALGGFGLPCGVIMRAVQAREKKPRCDG